MKIRKPGIVAKDRKSKSKKKLVGVQREIDGEMWDFCIFCLEPVFPSDSTPEERECSGTYIPNCGAVCYQCDNEI